jgi:hypothetical protein
MATTMGHMLMASHGGNLGADDAAGQVLAGVDDHGSGDCRNGKVPQLSFIEFTSPNIDPSFPEGSADDQGQAQPAAEVQAGRRPAGLRLDQPETARSAHLAGRRAWMRAATS